MDVEHKECLNTSLFLMGQYGLKTSGGRVKMEMGRIRRRVHQTAALDALGEQKPLVREVGTRRAPWKETVVLVGTATQISHGHRGLQDVLDVASFLASRNCEVFASVFTQT